jgi:hypothetical protein
MVTRLRTRALYPALAIAAGISALAGGLERTHFLGGPVVVESANMADSAMADSTVASAISIATAGLPSGTAATAAANQI